MELDIKIRILVKEKDGKRILSVMPRFSVSEFSLAEVYRNEKLSVLDEIYKAINNKTKELSNRWPGTECQSEFEN